MADSTESSIRINAEPNTVLDVIADLASYPQWATQVKAVTVLEEDDGGWPDQAEFHLDAGPIKDTYVLEYTWDVDEDGTGVISWTLVRANLLTVMDGSYTLRADAAATTVTYRLAVDIKLPLLGMVKRTAERVLVDTALKELKKRIEGLSQSAIVRLLLYTGPGGAGTSTLAAASAHALAAAGHRVLLGAVDDDEDLRATINLLDPWPRDRLALLDQPLSRPHAEWGKTQETLLTLLTRGGLDPAMAEEAPLLPGVGQVRAVLRLLAVARRTDADLLVLDLGSLREAAELLSLPTRLVWTLRRLMAATPDLGAAMRTLSFVTGGRPGAGARFVSQALARTETLAHVLRSEQSRVRLVVGPSPGGLRALARWLPELGLAGVYLDLVVRNGSAPASGGWSAEDLATHLPQAELVQLDTASTDLTQPQELARLVAPVSRQLSALDHPMMCLATRVEADQDGFVLRIRIRPQPDESLRVQRRGDDLLLTLSGRRHLVPLSGGLRRCRVVQARQVDGELQVHFRPEEGRWMRRD